MSFLKTKIAETLMYFKDEKWNSSKEPISTLKMEGIKPKYFQKFSCSFTRSEIELRELYLKHINKKTPKWEIVHDKTRFPRMIQTRSLLRDELEILKINMSADDRSMQLRQSQIFKNFQKEAKRKKKKKMRKLLKKPIFVFSKCSAPPVGDLLTEIEAFMFFSDSRSQNAKPIKVTCPNCMFYITTRVKRVSSDRTKLISLIFAIIGLCVLPNTLYQFKDVVHLCPLCRIYLGFCPAFNTGIRKRRSKSIEYDQIKCQHLKEKVSKMEKKMVSASSTSAKNLFVESKLRLSDRVQVNINNIAAITRQIQRGSKANENLMAAAKNFALQEAAIDNSEANLKKLKLLTTHINNQLDSLHNNSAKVETVLEQVRSMQR